MTGGRGSERYRVLCVVAHPDDIEFGCAGSVAVWTSNGADVTYCIVTDGSTGTTDADLFGPKLAARRRAETEVAAGTVGVTRIHFLDYTDGAVEPTLGLRKDIARVFRRERPHRLVVLDPSRLPGGVFVNHPDHRAVGQAALDVTLTAGTTVGHFPDLAADEGLEPWRGLLEIWIMGPGDRKHAVDITATVDRKIEALRAHASQVGEGVDDMIREWTASNGRAHGMTHAELFDVITPMGAPSDGPAPPDD